MGVEIERKFLLANASWRQGDDGRPVVGTPFRQGYLASGGGRTVRVRLAGTRGVLTIKGPTRGLARAEYEYDIPAVDAQELLDTLCDRPQIAKTRYEVRVGDHVWEIDEFHGDNAGLLVAEIELDSPDEAFERPSWLGREVSGDRRYVNSELAKKPFTQWEAP